MGSVVYTSRTTLPRTMLKLRLESSPIGVAGYATRYGPDLPESVRQKSQLAASC